MGSNFDFRHQGSRFIVLLIELIAMSRALRIEYKNAFYNVMNRGRGREDTFLSYDDFKYLLYSTEQVNPLFDIEVHSYCLFS